MGSLIFDFLTESFLFDQDHINDAYSSFDEKSLVKELASYREYVIKNIDQLFGEVDKDRAIKVFGASDFFSLESIKQTAFYVDQVIIPDPIFPFTRVRNNDANVINEYLGMGGDNPLDRKRLADSASIMKQTTPMVASNYMKYFPVSYIHEPDKKIPIRMPENNFYDSLPRFIMDYYHKNSEVKTLIKSDNGFLLSNSLERCRSIIVQLGDEHGGYEEIYNHFVQEITNYNKDTGEYAFKMTMPDYPPKEEEFKTWVFQSINSTSLGHFTSLQQQLMLSNKFDSFFLTSSNMVKEIMSLTENDNQTIQSHTAQHIMNFDLPFFRDVSIEDLMSIRDNDGEAFNLFRVELEKQFRELRYEKDESIIDKKIEDIIHELTEVQVQNINSKMSGLRNGVLAETSVALGGLAGSVLTGGVSLGATLIAVASGFKTYADYQKSIKENPSYFLWKVKNGSSPLC